jgi:N-acetylmuramic acid 6-phosphate etherase
VQAVVAGGQRALTQAVEGAEDDRAQGARDIAARHVNRGDVVLGIAASGSTPYVLGALEWARRRGAVTIGLTSNPRTPIVEISQIAIVVETGAEAITGSTRMKAGTAQKLVLNMLSTAVMIRLGRVYDNWMIGVALTNKKLQQRGVRILAEAANVSVAEATRALRQSRHSSRKTGTASTASGTGLQVPLIMLKTGASAAAARQSFCAAKGNLRLALKEKT